MATNNTSSYIDMEKLTASDFEPHQYANALVLSTNNSSDPSIDLTTPLSRALFDLQEIDSSIHTLTSRSALEILTYTSTQNNAAGRLLSEIEAERSRLNASYARLEAEVAGQHIKATSAKLNAERSHQVLRLGRSVQRILNIARQFEVQLVDSDLSTIQSGALSKSSSKEDHRLLVQASYTALSFRDIVLGKDSSDLTRVNIVRSVRDRIFEDGEARILEYSRKVVREFAISSLTTASGSSFAEVEDARLRFTSAVQILYLLSPTHTRSGKKMEKNHFQPEYMLRALQAYLQTAIQSSSGGIGRALGQLPTLDRSLIEASARCQNVVALEALLRNISRPEHPLLAETSSKVIVAEIIEDASDDESDIEEDNSGTSSDNLLDLLLESLDTPSLASYFWRSLASSLTTRVQEILNRGGVSARTLRANKDSVRNDIRDCVLRGSKVPSSVVTVTTGKSGKDQVIGNWEREAAVMVGSVMTPLNR